MAILDRTQAHATDGRGGVARSDDGRAEFKLSVPKALGGPGGDSTGLGIEVDLTVTTPGMDGKAVEDLVAKAHVVCLYSHAARYNIPVRLTVT